MVLTELQVELEKRDLQQKVDSSEIDSAGTLAKFVWRRGWRARVANRIGRNGKSVLIISPGVTKGFQISVGFSCTDEDFEQPGIWVYGLLARAAGERACYIGQSWSIMRRLAEHSKRSRPGRGSSGLFAWSEIRNAPVQVVLLELIRRGASKGETATRATVVEGMWLRAALQSGYQAPDMNQWGRLPSPSGEIRTFSEEMVKAVEKPIEKVIHSSLPLKHFWLGAAQMPDD